MNNKEKTAKGKLASELQAAHAKWKYVYENGGSDPFCEDGNNLNLLRNHILNYKRMCEENLSQDDYPEEYYLDVPDKMPINFMARKDEIKQNAKTSLEIYEDNDDYRYMLSHKNSLNKKEIEQGSINNILGYVSGLQHAIDTDDYLYMRRHENPSIYINSFESGRRYMEQVISEEKPDNTDEDEIYDGIDINGLTYEDLDPGVSNGHAVETGKYRNPNGTWSHVTRYEEYYKTKWGKLTHEEWTKLSLRVINAKGDGPLFDAILEHVRQRPWNKNAKEKVLRHDAAKSLIWGSWKAWAERGEFMPPAINIKGSENKVYIDKESETVTFPDLNYQIVGDL